MTVTDLTSTLAVVRRLIDEPDDLAPTVTVVGDVGRLLRSNPPPETVATLMSGIAAVRERVDRSPACSAWDHLQNPKGNEFAGGALWACEDILDAWKRAHEAREERTERRRARATCRQVVVDLLRTQITITPTDVRAAVLGEGIDAHPSTVSKAISDLLEEGLITPADPPAGASRRFRYYQSVEADPVRENLDRARRLLADINQQIGPEELADLVRQVTVDFDTDLTPVTDV